MRADPVYDDPPPPGDVHRAQGSQVGGVRRAGNFLNILNYFMGRQGEDFYVLPEVRCLLLDVAEAGHRVA